METEDEYFDDELYVPSNDYTNEATIDSQATLPELEPVTTTMDNQEISNPYSPTTPSSRLYIPPIKGRRDYTSVINAPRTFDPRTINVPEGTVQMSAGEILSSTRVPPQSNHTACVLQPANVASNPTNSTPAVSNTQASSLPQLPTSSSSG